MTRPTYVYRLQVTYPEGSQAPGWEPPGWEPEYDDGEPGDPAWRDFRWPPVRKVLTKATAERHATTLRAYGATVVVEESMPVRWSGDPS